MSLEDKIIDYKDNVSDIEHWVALKGEFRYESIINFLTENKIECTWSNITYYIKYDKRLLINSFKYIVFLEEMYKSFIYKYGDDKSIKNKNFQKVYYEFLLLGDVAGFDGVSLSNMKLYKKSINSFRNKVVHNNILIGQRFNGFSLEEIFKQFVTILPESYRKGFIKDINNCSAGILDNKWHITL